MQLGELQQRLIDKDGQIKKLGLELESTRSTCCDDGAMVAARHGAQIRQLETKVCHPLTCVEECISSVQRKKKDLIGKWRHSSELAAIEFECSAGSELI